jgi:hypothetical protein
MTAGLWTVAANDFLPALMGLNPVKEFPIQEPIWLVLHLQFWIHTSVDEDVGVGLKKSFGAIQEIPVAFHDMAWPIISVCRAVRNQGVQAAITLPKVRLQKIFPRIEDHDFVIAAEKNRPEFLFNLQESFD